ncbi:hypothetical protein C1645_838116 [Glomus cerebriforme]|uniref:Uncharacterized protein n=1 Tax=Glomus cerebriforme TaxID=658196 RepID=A0A397S436_9GLOM|nr:hypothetical protein C1645_838116 [Glomus cerebriforme]
MRGLAFQCKWHPSGRMQGTPWALPVLKCANPNKLCEHLNRKFKCKPIPIQTPTPQVKNQGGAPVVHVRGKDRRKEKSKVVNPIPDLQLVNQTPVPVSEFQKEAPILGIDYITEEEAKNWISPNARKPGENYKTWEKRLVQKWKELDLGDHDIPVSLDDCLTLYHDLEQYDPEAVRQLTLKELEKYSKVSPRDEPSEVKQQDGQVDSEAGPGPATQANRKKQRKIVVPITAKDIHFKECPVEVLQIELHRKDQIKSAIVVKCLYLLDKKDKEDFANKVYKVKYHRGEMRPILLEEDIDEHITLTVGEIDKQVEEALLKGSGYTLERIEEISIEAYTLRRGTAGSHKLTPKRLANTKSTINPDNKGLIDPETNKPCERCLKGALDIVKLDGIPMPTPICSRIFDKIEEMNPDISISVWEWKEETATPKPVIATLTDITKSEDDKYGQKNHFLWIKNSSRLIYGNSAHKEKKHLYDGCIQSWPSEKALEHHIEWCPRIHKNASQRVTMPVKGVNNFEEFKNYGRMINAPCVIIADFEADNKKCDEAYGGSMRKLAEQKANKNATQEFVRRIDQELVKINEVLAIKHERIETEEDKKRFADAISCWICKGYDSHLVCESVGRSANAQHIRVIAETFERYKSMKVGQLKYIDSQQFMNNGLANLTKNLGDVHPITSQHFKDFTPDQISLATRKGIYPYDYIDSHDRFKEAELPSIHEFHSTLKGKISQEDYIHAQKV